MTSKKTVNPPLNIRLKNSAKGVFTVMKKPKYILIAVVASFFISGFILWSLNFDLVQYIIFDAPISVWSKLRFFWDVQTGIYSVHSSVQATGILIFGAVFGINISLMTYVTRRGGLSNIPKKSGGGGLIIAMVAGGCVACGTSILAPLLVTFGATSSVFLQDLSNILSWIGIFLILYSIYKLGGIINNKQTEKHLTK